jgi:hypothetical protein
MALTLYGDDFTNSAIIQFDYLSFTVNAEFYDETGNVVTARAELPVLQVLADPGPVVDSGSFNPMGSSEFAFWHIGEYSGASVPGTDFRDRTYLEGTEYSVFSLHREHFEPAVWERLQDGSACLLLASTETEVILPLCATVSLNPGCEQVP